jgi:predicted ATPase
VSDSSDPVLIRRLQPRNFLSFGPEVPGIELRALNLLIGPNGSGKSNLIEAISLMRAAPKDWGEVTRKGGGVGEWIWKGGHAQPASISLTFRKDDAETPLIHEMKFQPHLGQFDLVAEQIHDEAQPGGMEDGYYSTAFAHGGPTVARTNPLGGRDWDTAPSGTGRSVLTLLRDPVHYPEITWLAEKYERIRIYREWTFGRNSNLRRPQPTDMRSNGLEEDCSNLGLVLSRLRKSPKVKRAILQHLQDLYDGISDFDVAVEGGTVQVFFTEGDHAIPATRLSDGALRYLCLLAILCDPEPPPLICIEEPELGLHPDILPNLARLLKTASELTQMIVTTHSDILIDAISETPEAVIVCEKQEGQTSMERLSKDKLEVWLEKYRLGDLWLRGHLGGKRW